MTFGEASISVVMFDLDDTVFDHVGARAAGLTAHRRTLGLTGDDATEVERWVALEEEWYPFWLRGELTHDGQRRARVRAYAAAHGIDLTDDADADTWFAGYFAQYRRAWALHDDARPAFDELERRIPGVRFGIITNGDLEQQTAKIVAVELDVRVEQVIASGAVGVAKPDARIFHLACERFGVDPGDAVYIGDRLRTDAIGAVAAGLTGVWIDRACSATAEQVSEAVAAGAHVIHTLAELPELLAPRI